MYYLKKKECSKLCFMYYCIIRSLQSAGEKIFPLYDCVNNHTVDIFVGNNEIFEIK